VFISWYYNFEVVPDALEEKYYHPPSYLSAYQTSPCKEVSPLSRKIIQLRKGCKKVDQYALEKSPT
jgi:hypothetical protein